MTYIKYFVIAMLAIGLIGVTTTAIPTFADETCKEKDGELHCSGDGGSFKSDGADVQVSGHNPGDEDLTGSFKQSEDPDTGEVTVKASNNYDPNQDGNNGNGKDNGNGNDD